MSDAPPKATDQETFPVKCIRNFPLGNMKNDEEKPKIDIIQSMETRDGEVVVKLLGGEEIRESVKNKNLKKKPKHLSTPSDPFRRTDSVMETHKQPIYAAAFNPYQEGAHTFFATAAKNMISIYECTPTSMTLRRSFVDDNAEESFFALTWLYDSVNGKHCIAVGGCTGFIKILDVTSGLVTNNLLGHGDVVNELRTDPNNSLIFASVSKDTTVRIWNVRIPICLVVLGGLEGHLDQVLSCDWSPDSYFLVSCGMDHSIRMWYLHDKARKLIAYSMTPEGEKKLCEQRESTSVPPTVHINYPNAWTTDLHTDYVDCIRFYNWHFISKGTERVAHLSRFGQFDEAPDQLFPSKADTVCSKVATLDIPGCDVWFLKFDVDPLMRWIVFGSKEGDLYFFDMHNREHNEGPSNYVIKVGNSPIRQVSFSPDGKVLIAATDSQTVYRLDRVIEAPILKEEKVRMGVYTSNS